MYFSTKQLFTKFILKNTNKLLNNFVSLITKATKIVYSKKRTKQTNTKNLTHGKHLSNLSPMATNTSIVPNFLPAYFAHAIVCKKPYWAAVSVYFGAQW